MEEFQSLSKNVLELFESLAAKVERMKMRAIGSRNRLKLISKQKLEQQELLESRVLEARIECERLCSTSLAFLLWWGVALSSVDGPLSHTHTPDGEEGTCSSAVTAATTVSIIAPGPGHLDPTVEDAGS
ncbi:unnamed protein product [Schistocephalus solidus]|uniref:V-type proton ATPase subunit a n=1 Tax=Schistocephalus solidus TaxID=70667 RepID=A0A183SRN6_SCHSO|nr:unnamed protein product [Schistocephalus solidus]